ncbi:AMP-binding protein [Streptomyces sp. NPDC040724]|uniref:AMP-binding protein n=1 Tax=unclassified Streptomyces TaxID=2593676 RepID=UPI0033C0C7BA
MSTVVYRDLGRQGHGVTFLDSRGVTAELAYADLERQARSVAAGLGERGLRRGERVLLPLPTGPDYLVALLACLLSGTVPCTVAPPTHTDAESAGVRRFHAALAAVRPAAVITPDAATAPAPATEGGPVHLTLDELRHHEPLTDDRLPEPRPDDLHHIQLTSGSTSAPKAAALTHANTAANLRALVEATGLRADRDRLCEWLPLHHDMGFVMVLLALSTGAPLDLMPSIGFLRDPLSWLRHLAVRGGTITAAPPFGYRTALERYRRKPEPGLDLSRVRRAYVGAEPIPLNVLSDFQDAFAPHGLAQDVLIPCYGMAETVLASTMPGAPYPGGHLSRGHVRALRVDRADLQDSGLVTPARAGRNALTTVSCGRPIGGLDLEIRKGTGGPCGEGEVGEIHLGGASVMAGYLGPDGLPVPPPGGKHATGDLGFQLDGDLYVVGRVKEMLVVRGRNIPPYDVEEAIEAHRAVMRGNSAVFSYTDDAGGEHVVAVVEVAPADTADGRLRLEIDNLVRQGFGFGLRDTVLMKRGGIARTTSGKRQRGRMRQLYLAGELS